MISPNEKGICYNFSDCTYKNSDKSYGTKLPFKETHPILSDNFNLSLQKLKNLYSKLKNDPKLLKHYNEILLSKRNKE